MAQRDELERLGLEIQELEREADDLLAEFSVAADQYSRCAGAAWWLPEHLKLVRTTEDIHSRVYILRIAIILKLNSQLNVILCDGPWRLILYGWRLYALHAGITRIRFIRVLDQMFYQMVVFWSENTNSSSKSLTNGILRICLD